MKTNIQSQIFAGETVSLWKEPGIYVLDFPSVSIRIAEDQIDEVVEDFEKIIENLREKKNEKN